jgi:cell division protein FtsB
MTQIQEYIELQSQIKELESKNKRLEFINTMVKGQNEKLRNENIEKDNIINNLKQEIRYYENKYIKTNKKYIIDCGKLEVAIK